MKSHIRGLFTFTDSERNGTVVLLILILMVSIIVSLQDKFISLPRENFTEFDAFLATVDSAEYSKSFDEDEKKYSREKENISGHAEEVTPHSLYHKKELFNFNPNGLSTDDWVRLGLSAAQARSVKNFEAKGGKFETKEDVKKLFVISAERYAELEPFIVLPEKSAKSIKDQSPISNHQSPLPSVVELNTADSSLLVSVNGIGPAFAKRILEYRERLGGFHSINQLTEIYGIDTEKFAAIKNSVKADSSYIHKINLNTAVVSEFKRLPYISPNVANALVNYRKAHGSFKNVADIKGCALINEELYRKIVPYLSL